MNKLSLKDHTTLKSIQSLYRLEPPWKGLVGSPIQSFLSYFESFAIFSHHISHTN